MVPAYTLPPNAQDVKILRALVKETMSREQVERRPGHRRRLRTLDEKGGEAHAERDRSSRAPATDPSRW